MLAAACLTRKSDGASPGDVSPITAHPGRKTLAASHGHPLLARRRRASGIQAGLPVLLRQQVERQQLTAWVCGTGWETLMTPTGWPDNPLEWRDRGRAFRT